MKKSLIILSTFLLIAANTFAASSKILMLRDNGPLRIANDSNGVEWSETVAAGTELELESKELVIKDLITSSKTYPDVKFFKVKYNKKTYYVQESDAEPCDSASVIQADALLFSKPTLSAFRNAVLETGTLVVVDNNDTVTEYNNKFVRISFYDTNDGLKRSRYVNADKISSSDKDVKAIIILEKARKSENEDLKKELLDNAASMKTTELISDYIKKETAKILNISTFSDDAIISIPEAWTGYIFTNDGSKVNVRSLPGTAGEVIGQFNSEDYPTVLVTMKTEDTEEIDGKTESWYYVTEYDIDNFTVVADGIEGWVFGGFIGHR